MTPPRCTPTTAAAFVTGLPVPARRVVEPRLRARRPAAAATRRASTGGSARRRRRARLLVAFAEPPSPPPSSASPRAAADAEPPLSLRPPSGAPGPAAARGSAAARRRRGWPTDQKLSFFDWHLVFGLFTVAVVERTTTALSAPSLLHSAQAAFVMAVTALVYRIRA